MQHKLYVEEMQALKEVRRNDKAQQVANLKKIDECLVMLDRKIKFERLVCNKNFIYNKELSIKHVRNQG